jgi:hypothetical protein
MVVYGCGIINVWIVGKDIITLVMPRIIGIRAVPVLVIAQIPENGI